MRNSKEHLKYYFEEWSDTVVENTKIQGILQISKLRLYVVIQDVGFYKAVLGLRGQALVAGRTGSYRSGFCKELLEASPMSHRATGQGQANQQ